LSSAVRALYHFAKSPFSRRARLALAHKGLDCELREARENPSYREEASRLVAQKTIPVLVDGDVALGDSTAIARWLDAKYPGAPRLWLEGTEGPAVLDVAALVDVALTAIVDLGTHYYALRDHPSFPVVRAEIHGRAQRALDALGARVDGKAKTTLGAQGWSAADIWLFTAAEWMEGLPARVGSNQNAAQIVALGGWTLPSAVRRWTDSHRDRPDVVALG
jgi:glutathione S-transferase